jgi:DNA-binding NarL/FixJ family response regulator
MAMLRGPSTAALDIPADLSAEGVDVVAAAQPAGATTTSTTGSRLPIGTSSTNSHREGGAGRLSQRVALIDPKPLTRRLIGDLLAEAFPEYAIVTASTCDELLEIEGMGRPNLVVIYIRSAGLTNTCVQSALELLRERLPEALAVVLSDRDDVDEINRALTHGVRGYIPTSVGCEIAVAALRLISTGGTFVPADALRSTAAKLDDQPEGEGERRGRSDGLNLTPRELSVIDLLREGKPNKLIAAQLDMQESTVKVHVRNILKKLNAANRTHAAFVVNRLLGQHAEPVALPNSLRPIDQGHSPDLAARGTTDAACDRAAMPSVQSSRRLVDEP